MSCEWIADQAATIVDSCITRRYQRVTEFLGQNIRTNIASHLRNPSVVSKNYTWNRWKMAKMKKNELLIVKKFVLDVRKDTNWQGCGEAGS